MCPKNPGKPTLVGFLSHSSPHRPANLAAMRAPADRVNDRGETPARRHTPGKYHFLRKRAADSFHKPQIRRAIHPILADTASWPKKPPSPLRRKNRPKSPRKSGPGRSAEASNVISQSGNGGHRLPLLFFDLRPPNQKNPRNADTERNSIGFPIRWEIRPVVACTEVPRTGPAVERHDRDPTA